MKQNALMKDLIRNNYLVGLVSATSAFLILHFFKMGSNTPLPYAVFVGVRSFVLGLANLLILVLLRRLLPTATAKRKKWLQYSTGYLFAFIFFFCINPLELYLSLPHSGPDTLIQYLPSILIQAIMNNTIVLTVQNLTILHHEKVNAELENSKLRAANLESAYLLLKQQIHPHFLFNALSMLKSLYKEDVPAGEKYLSHLVNFLRASQGGSHSSISRLPDEIRLCNDYLEMQKIRFDNALVCTIDIPEPVLLHGSVPSFAIQSLIENAIKHNGITESSPLIINVFYKDGYIVTENNLQARTYIDEPSGKGLMNLVERYRILSAAEVIIRQDNNNFSVSIKVLSNEISYHRR
jgi:LytS/YehU family sensor histidine kinase